MNSMAEYARIFVTGTDDDWVNKRKSAASDMGEWLIGLSPQKAIDTASAIAASIADGSDLPDEIATVGQGKIQAHASSFVRSADQGELQIKVVMMASAIDVVSEQSGDPRVWNTVDALAAAFWSAFSFQRPLVEIKIEGLRRDLLVASRTRILRSANKARQRRPVPSIGPVGINQESSSDTRVNSAFSKAVEPMISVMRDNAALDREELDFMWWLLSDRSDILNEPLSGMSDIVRAVVAGLDAASKLRKLPADAHRHIVLRGVKDGDRLSLAEVIDELDDRRDRLAASLSSLKEGASTVFPLLTAIVTGAIHTPLEGEKFTASEWGARALLEGAIYHLQEGTAGGL